MTPNEALAASLPTADGDSRSKSSEADLELAGLTTGVLVLLAALWSLLGHQLSSRSRYLNESGTACLLGLAAGSLLLAFRNHSTAGLVDGLLRFNSAAFFTYLLPPVILYAGLSVEQRLFFSNLPSILSFGILGTLVSFVLISAAVYSLAGTTFGMDAQDCLALGAVFAATDSVAVLGLLDPRASPQLFSLVFGEGIVNDATSVVLLGALTRMARQQRALTGDFGADPAGMFKEEGGVDEAGPGQGESLLVLASSLMGNFGYLLLTSTLLGVSAGVGVVAILRHRLANQGPHHEVAVVGLLSYLAYLAAEVLGLSAILSLFCCGATVSHFALRNGVAAPPPSLEPSVHGGGGAGTGPGLRGAAGGHGADGVVVTAEADTPRRAGDDDGGGGSWYGGSEEDGQEGRGMLWVLAAPAKRLAARAFGGVGGGDGCMSVAGASATVNAFRSLSYVAEGLIFVYLGMDCLDPVRWEASYVGEVVWLVGVLLFFMMAARAASVVPLSMLHNLYAPRHQQLSGRDMLVIWWSGLMRGAVSVALVYLNFDTADGSQPAAAAIFAPHSDGPRGAATGTARAYPSIAGVAGAPGVGLHHHRHLLQAAANAAASAAASAGAGAAAGTSPPPANATSAADASAALSVAAALAEATELQARQHATLIVATLLAVVISVLVVSTFTKPVLQAALEADPRKPPLQVLGEALFDPWVDATWRLRIALGRSYRRWTVGGVQDDREEAEGLIGGVGGAGGGAGGSGVRRAVAPSLAAALAGTHSIPMTALVPTGAGPSGGSLSLTVGNAGAAATSAGAGGDGLPGRSLSAAAAMTSSSGAAFAPKGPGELPSGTGAAPGGTTSASGHASDDHAGGATAGRGLRNQALQQRANHGSASGPGGAAAAAGGGAVGGGAAGATERARQRVIASRRGPAAVLAAAAAPVWEDDGEGGESTDGDTSSANGRRLSGGGAAAGS